MNALKGLAEKVGSKGQGTGSVSFFTSPLQILDALLM